MKITNKHNLPEPIVRAVQRDPYKREGHISATGLLNPVRQTVLKERYSEYLTEDVSDLIWALMGSNFHYVLERAALDELGAIIEKRVSMQIGGWKVTGQADILMNKKLSDYKFTSVYAVSDGVKPEWTQQIDIYKALYNHNGYEVDSGEIVAIFRDWSKLKAKHDMSYPQSQIMVLPILTSPDFETIEFMRNKLQTITTAKGLNDNELPPCTHEERWGTKPVYAVKKNKNKRAVKLHNSEDSAHAMCDDKNGGKDTFWVEYRPPEYKRCENYCSVCDFCNQWQADKAKLK